MIAFSPDGFGITNELFQVSSVVEVFNHNRSIGSRSRIASLSFAVGRFLFLGPRRRRLVGAIIDKLFYYIIKESHNLSLIFDHATAKAT